MTQLFEFGALGLFAGAYGTMIGAGGGFLIVPALLFLFHFNVASAVATSLCAVFCNAASATIGYTRQRRVDYPTGLRFALGSIGGALLGAALTGALHADAFIGIFGALLITIGIAILRKPEHPFLTIKERAQTYEAFLRLELKVRRITDTAGRRFEYFVNLKRGLIISTVAGVISSLFGVGGGILIVPAQIMWMKFPPPIAVTTSSLILTISSLTGALFYASQGEVDWGPAAALSAGAVLGAQAGVTISRHLSSTWITRLLSLALLGIGTRMLAQAVGF